MNTNKRTAIYLSLASALVLGCMQVQAAGGNTNFGTGALSSVTSGTNNSAFGEFSLFDDNTGGDNTAIGFLSLASNTTGNDNTASGVGSLAVNTTGSNNTASGDGSLFGNTTGNDNTAIGFLSLNSNTTGNGNMASGLGALALNTTGGDNTASGSTSLFNNTTGFSNTALGDSALFNNTTGMRNVGLGEFAGASNLTGSGNVFLGSKAGFNATGSNKLYISNNPTTPLLYGVFNATAAKNKLGIGTATVAAGDAIKVWNGALLTKGGVWTNASSRELKDNIETLSTEDANEALAALSPVRYVYKNSRDEEYMGFIAEDVPDLVASNDRKSLSPMDIVAVLTTVTKDQKATLAKEMAEKDAEIASLKAELQTQKVKQDERMLQMEMALAEVLRHQAGEVQVSSSN